MIVFDRASINRKKEIENVISYKAIIEIDNRSQVSLAFGTYTKIHCLNRFNISRKYHEFSLNSNRKVNISRFSDINALGIKLTLP